MGFKEGVIQASIVFGIFATIGYVILAKVKQNNPKAAEWMSKIRFGSIYEKVEEVPFVDKIEQLHSDERRTLM